MPFAGRGHGLGQASGAGVVAAHRALQFREFADHRGLQIGLDHAGGLFGQIGIGPDHRRNLTREGGDAGDPVGLRAKLVVEGDIGQPRRHAFKAGVRDGAQVILPKEFRIREAGRQHLVVARQNGGTVIGGFAVGDGDEAFDPPGFRVADREELLMLAHRGLQNLRRKPQKIRANRTHQDDGPFDKP